MELMNDVERTETVDIDNYTEEKKIIEKTISKFLNYTRMNQKGVKKSGIILLVVIMLASLFFSSMDTYKRVNWTGQSSTRDTKIILKANGTYEKNGDNEKGTYSVYDEKITLHPANDDKDINYLKTGKYLYCERGWFEDDSPYFDEKIEAGKKIDQTLSYVSYGNGLWIERTLKLYNSGRYEYIEESSVFGNGFELRETGTYKRREEELVLKSDDRKKRIMPIVEGKVVYVEVYKK